MKSQTIGRTIERIEIIRASLRWTNQLDKQGINKILSQLNQLRNDLLVLSRKQRYEKQNITIEKSSDQATVAERRYALFDNDFYFTGVIGDNPELLTVLETLAKAAKTNFPVIIEGESGTGKELLAKVVHANSSRVDKPYISVNCGAIPSALLESELFGHVKGAFTGAETARKGKFEHADGGTLFLDELGELSLENQVKLLRALQTGEIQRVGSDSNIMVDVRIVAATNKKLYKMVLSGQFREDLYYRLGVITVTVPPLRKRSDEIPMLIDYFVQEAADKMGRQPVRLSPRLLKFLRHYEYRGNIRELKNIIYRVSCLADTVGGIRHLPDILRPEEIINKNQENNPSQTLEQVKSLAKDAAEERFLRENLTNFKGQVTKLAKKLNMNRSYLQTLMKKHGLKSRDFK